MSQKLCTAEWIAANQAGVEFTPEWFPSMVAERMAVSTRDGAVDRAPDQIPFIDTEILWTNTSDSSVHVMVSVQRGSRSVVASSPATLVLDDAWTFDVGTSPAALTPYATQAGVGARFKDRRTTDPDIFNRVFRDFPDFLSYVEVGEVRAGESVQFRYRCLFSTPGEWKSVPSPRYEASARWARLRMFTSPFVAGVV